MRRSIRLTLLLAAVGCLLVSGIAIARAASIEIKVKGVSWANDNHKITGYLDAERTPEGVECVKGRRIVVKYLDKNERVGSGRTESGRFPGGFEIGLGGYAPVGTYRVIAKKMEVNSIVCEKGSTKLEQPHAEND